MRLDSLMQELALQAQQNQHGASTASQELTDPTHAYYDHSSGLRISTEAYMTKILRKEFPNMQTTAVAPPVGFAGPTLLEYANATGKASYRPLTDDDPLNVPFATRQYFPPARRINGPSGGRIAENLQFGKYEYKHKGASYLLYAFSSRDGDSYYPQTFSQFLVHAPTSHAQAAVLDLIKESGQWATLLHDEIWLFDQGSWKKDAGLYASVMKAQWKDVILDEDKKKTIQSDARHFFDSRERYDKLKVPWKRGVIYYGPPGNGKTISIKALSHELYSRADPVPTLYVKSFASFGGPEYSIRQIFTKARAEAPCLLVFEDLDSLVTDSVRSYFLNEVDGLAANEGVLMIGSTNHLDRLDPGISKRPSRFDRKFNFPKPNLEQREQYAEYWRGKLADNEDVEFPRDLSPEIARITDEFSFAYLQEVFVASLLAIAFDKEEEEEGERCVACKKQGNLDDLPLWREIKKAVKTLREEM